MEREILPAKPTLKHLMVLKVLVDHRYGIQHTGGGMRKVHSKFFVPKPLALAPQEFHGWFEKNECDRSDITYKMYKWGWLNHMEKPEWDDEKKSWSGLFHWDSRFYVLNKLGLAYWEEHGKDKYEKLMAAEQAKREAVDRLVIIGPKSGRGIKKPDRKAGMLVRVTKETGKRLYVDVVDHAEKEIYEFYFIEGTRGKTYVSKDQVWKDDVTEEQYRKIVEVENHIVSEKKRLRSERDEAIEEVRNRFREREDQMAAQHAELLRNTHG